MTQPRPIESLYEQNQRLGYRLNYLNDENNFYRISINNIKKLNQNINKNLLTTNTKLANKNPNAKPDPRNITESYTLISNKIQLKNLQMKVGNSKRRVDKLEKLYEGSVSTLVKKSQELEKEINKLSREYEYYTIQNQLLDNIFMGDSLVALMEDSHLRKWQTRKTTYEARSRASKVRGTCVGNGKMAQLQDQEIRCSNKLQHVLKEQKELKRQRTVLMEKLITLKEERDKLGSQVYNTQLNLREAQAVEVNKLTVYNRKEEELQEEIVKQDALLEEQYKINQEYKQKIMDRNEQEVKQIKVLQEEIKKCAEQVKEIKSKCDNLEVGKSKKTPKVK